MGKNNSLTSNSEKGIFDVVYINHKELGIDLPFGTTKEDRPCLIVDYDKNNGLYYVLILTTKRKDNVFQVRIGNGSYINFDKKFAISKPDMDYAMESDRTFLSKEDEKNIEDNLYRVG